MNENSFSHSQFFINITSVPEGTLSLSHVVCQNDSISSHYQFRCVCIAEQYHESYHWIRKHAILSFHDIKTSAVNYRYGVIASAKYFGQFIDGFHYQLVLVSLLHPLTLRFTERVFLNKSFNEIVSTILQTAGFSSLQYQLQGKNNPAIRYRVQYGKSDYVFLQSLLFDYGYQFVFQQNESRCVLLITDHLSSLNGSTQTVQPIINSSITQITALIPPQVTMVSTQHRLLQPGQLIELKNKKYRIVTIKHTITQNTALHTHENELRYCAELSLIDPILTLFINPQVQELIKMCNAPLFTAKTETAGGLYPFINENGCYFTRLPFDHSNSPSTEKSPPQYLLQSHNGMHFPLKTNMEMAVSHWEGDINQPVLLGAFADPASELSVNNANNSQYLYRSFSGNQLLMDDIHQREKIQLNNPQCQNVLLLDGTISSPQIELKSIEGQINYTISQNAFCQTKSCHLQNVQQSLQVTVQNMFELITVQQNLNSGRNMVFTAANNLNLQTQLNDIQFNSRLQSTLTSNNVLMQSQNDLQLTSIQENIQLMGKKNLTFQSNNIINLQADDSSLSLGISGLMINTPTLTINAPVIYCPQPS